MDPTHREVIVNLGGATALSKALFKSDRRRNMVSMWQSRDNIPWRWRLAVKKIAERRGVKVPADFMTPEPSA